MNSPTPGTHTVTTYLQLKPSKYLDRVSNVVVDLQNHLFGDASERAYAAEYMHLLL